MSNSLHLSGRRSLTVPMLFASLEDELKAQLLAQNHPTTYTDGQFIQHRGSKADGFWLIEEGAVRIGQFLPDGEFRAMALLGEGDSWGELAVFTGSARVVDGLSRGTSKVRFIPATTFLSALSQYPRSNQAMLRALSAQMQDMIDQLTGLRRGTNPTRLAALLVNLAGPDGTTKVTQQELAELLGVTRATANAALGTLEEKGLVKRGYGSVMVTDRNALNDFAIS